MEAVKVGSVTHSVKKEEEKEVIYTHLTGFELLANPRLNKGTAFTNEERTEFGLHGLLPPHLGTLESQRERRKTVFDSRQTPFAKYSLMRDLQDSCEVLFYSFIEHNIEEMLPIVYTPAVGEGCQRFSEIWRKPRGLFISYPNRNRIDEILADPRYDNVRCIVVSDGERILGLGDQGAGGMGIPIGKMALYTALAGIPPEDCLPILLDVGTDNEALLDDSIYIGWRHKRVRGQEYDDFVEAFVQAVKRRWPDILLQWEDFSGVNALRLLDRYRDQLCTFNDDIQGTAAVTTATLMCAMNASGKPLKDHRIAFFGSGAAGAGIAALLTRAFQEAGLSLEEARQHIYFFNRYGLVVEGGQGIKADQAIYARKRSEVEGWKVEGEQISLLDTMRNVGLTVLIGTSAQAGAFTEEIVRTMAKHSERPIIFPLSNPTCCAEAKPEDLLRWTDGKAIAGAGSPFPPVEINGRMIRIAQVNNSYIFPGLALGILAARASRVSDAMIMAAAKALTKLSPALEDPTAPLLPPVSELRYVSKTVALAVGAQALADGAAGVADQAAFERALEEYIWEPVYLPYKKQEKPEGC
jgi:malate dehydrogenase (oxaloacetate-decarboxylating)